MFLAGCAEGNLLRLRHDLEVDAAREIEALVALEPPFTNADAEPLHLQRYCERLGAEPQFGLTFALPHRLAVPQVEVVHSASAAGEALLERLTREGMPEHLVAAGFGDVGELWAPWTMLLEGGEIAAIAFAARLAERGAALGLYTFPPWRGRGLAAAVTAAWTRHPDLQSRTLFYGCSRDNRSSRGVVDRLGLRFIGPTMRLA